MLRTGFLVPLISWYWAPFLFDTLGSAVGAKRAYWVIILMGLLPVTLYGLVWWPLTSRNGGLVDRLLAMQQAFVGGHRRERSITEVGTEMVENKILVTEKTSMAKTPNISGVDDAQQICAGEMHDAVSASSTIVSPAAKRLLVTGHDNAVDTLVAEAVNPIQTTQCDPYEVA